MQHFLKIFHYGNGTLKVFTKKRSDFRAPRNTKKRRSGREKLNKKKNTIEFEKQTSDISIVECRTLKIPLDKLAHN